MPRGCLALLAIPAAVAALLLVVLGMLVENWRDTLDRDEVGTNLILGGELVAYDVRDWTPYVAFLHRGRGTLVLDRLWPDLSARDWPPRPAWQLTGNWYGIPPTTDAVSIGLSRCTGQMSVTDVSSTPFGTTGCRRRTIVFGQINDPAIVAIEVEYEGAWHRYPVSAPGYVVALAPFRGIPSGYRWLDAGGAVLEERAPIPELLWR